MGLCLSCCPISSDSDSVGPDGDRAGLLQNERVQGNDVWNNQLSDDEPMDFQSGSLAESYGQLGGIHFPSSLPKPKKNDEQTALNGIVHKLASDIIDVNMAHTTQTLEASDLQERAYEYGRKLHAESSKLTSKWANLKHAKADGLVDSGINSEKLIHSEVLNQSDTLLINEVAARAREANQEFQVQHVPGLVGQFGNIHRRTNEIEDTNESDNEDEEDVKEENDEGSSNPNETGSEEEQDIINQIQNDVNDINEQIKATNEINQQIQETNEVNEESEEFIVHENEDYEDSYESASEELYEEDEKDVTLKDEEELDLFSE